MRAVEITEFGKPEVLQICVRDVPRPGAEEVLIKVHAAGINRPDVLQRKGHYPVPAGASDIPGLEVAGEIVGGDLTGSDFSFGIIHIDRIVAIVLPFFIRKPLTV